MATIIVEDGTIVAGANSYITEIELDTYAADRGVTVVGTKAQLLISAMDYIESLSYQGQIIQYTQPLQWPRGGVVIDGYSVPITTIPQLLKDALAETALAIDAGNSPIGDVERVKDQVTVGTISVTYSKSAASTTIVRKISTKLKKLLSAGNTGFSFEVDR